MPPIMAFRPSCLHCVPEPRLMLIPTDAMLNYPWHFDIFQVARSLTLHTV